MHGHTLCTKRKSYDDRSPRAAADCEEGRPPAAHGDRTVRTIEKVIHVNRLSYAVSLALASLVAGNAALAQSTAPSTTTGAASAPQAGSPGDN